ncbi:uncharacterized protein FOMMEDRAFT_159817 [Fomitiporia mediterranea MF3/22]|uniref:uncharacterized protein n=1 Tax=Fomitiporia mediterranea (strain MF3/22) TaxID=694068 RepID=UPI00044082A1|nr:uncharacterized protein FOMMEDRAFT_159817 [Fomitiporia mediterranea MF3/22]EJD00171.1 hypothetical protein FOMMEDRAFT_159817 [Fomitiporia mediterranea MF3/22]
MAFEIDKACLVSIMIESMLFGIFTVLYVLASYLLHYKTTVSGPLRIRFFWALSVMYILGLMHLAVNMERSLKGFTDSYVETGGSTDYLSTKQGFLDVSRIVIYALQSLIGDVLILYRVYIVCSGDKRVLIPALAVFIGGFASGIGMIVSFSKQNFNFSLASNPLNWMIAFFSFSFIVNFGGTVAITLRIWLTRRKMPAATPTFDLSPLVVVLLDPGIFYSISLLGLFGLFLARSLGLAVVVEWITQIIGIVFSLIIIRIGFKRIWNGRLEYPFTQRMKRLLPMPAGAGSDRTSKSETSRDSEDKL